MLYRFRYLIILLLIVGITTGGIYIYKKRNPKYVPLPPRPEITLTIIPGWNLRQVADYLVLKGLASSTEQVFELTGEPAKKYKPPENGQFGPSDELLETKPYGLSMEGYLAPETLRVYADGNLADDVIDKFYFARKKELTPKMFEQAEAMNKTMHQILTMASIIEKEVKYDKDRAIVSDIMWRRYKQNWALQVDSSVHYIAARTGDVYTTAKERKLDSAWNTYKYPGLPPGPICNPSVKSINAALSPEKNEYWYYLSDAEGNMHYARTLEEHNANKYRYLK